MVTHRQAKKKQLIAAHSSIFPLSSSSSSSSFALKTTKHTQTTQTSTKTKQFPFRQTLQTKKLSLFLLVWCGLFTLHVCVQKLHHIKIYQFWVPVPPPALAPRPRGRPRSAPSRPSPDLHGREPCPARKSCHRPVGPSQRSARRGGWHSCLGRNSLQTEAPVRSSRPTDRHPWEPRTLRGRQCLPTYTLLPSIPNQQ